MSINMNPQKTGVEVQGGNTLKVETADSATQRQLKQETKISANPTSAPESKLQPSKAADTGNATAESNTVSSNTVTVTTAASDAPLPTLPQVETVAKVSSSL